MNAALTRNIALITIAVLVFARGSDAPTIRLPGMPGEADLLPLTLTLGTLVASVLVSWRASVWLARGGRA